MHATAINAVFRGGASADKGESAEFKLLRFFATTSLIAFVVVAVLLGYLFRTFSIDGLLQSYETEHVNQAQIIANQMWDDDFGPLVAASADKSATELQATASLPALHEKLQRLLKGTKIFKIKVYDLRGMTVYSTNFKQIGEDKSRDAGVANGLRGLNSSALSHKDQFSTFEGEVSDRDLVETYVPRYDPQSGQVSGVFEIYGDATLVVAEIGRHQREIVAAVAALLLLLFAALFAIVKRAQDIIDAHNRERESAQSALALSEERWKFALEGAGDGVWDRNLQTDEVVFSRRYKELYGLDEDEPNLTVQAWDARVHPDDMGAVTAEREAYLSGNKSSYASEHRVLHRDGSWKWILSRGMVASRDALGHPLRLIGTHTDITERHEREEALRLAATVSLTMDEGVMITNIDNLITSVNPAFSIMTGYSEGEVIGKNPRLLASGLQTPEFYKGMWSQLGSTGSWHGEIQNRRKGGGLYLEWLSIKQVRNQRGQPTHYVAVFSDISERKADENRMRQLAHFDVLTGLPNRALFSDRLRQAVAKARRDNTQVALMFIDLDKFKPVNDDLGHHVGDMLLKAVASRLLDCVRRESDTVGRLGGDEFVVLLPEMESSGAAIAVAENILDALNQPFEIGQQKHQIHISSSIGVAMYPGHGSDQSLLLKSADAAMYRAKEGGGNRIQLAQYV